MNINNKRINKRQRELLLERLNANIEVVRGNQADSEAIEFWENLARELNDLGCSRTVQEWQHDIQSSTQQTIPALEIPSPLSAGIVKDSSSGVLDVPCTSSALQDELPLIIEESIQQSQPTPSQPAPSHSAPIQASPCSNCDLPRLCRRQPRSRRVRFRRPRTNEALIQALNENGRACRETILQGAHVIAAAISSLRPQTNPQPQSPNPQLPSPNTQPKD